MEKLRVIHLITSLETGGAQMMLYKLVSSINSHKFESYVISLKNKGTIGENIKNIGIPVYALGLLCGKSLFSACQDLFGYMRRIKPDIIHGWMYHGNFAASALGFLWFPSMKVLWNIRHTPYDLNSEKKFTALLIRFGRVFCLFSQKIVYNSYASAGKHEALGYLRRKRIVIPNGFDTQRFKPSPESRIALRKELGISEKSVLVGHIARYHPMKDHLSFLRAAAILHKRRKQVHLVMVGKGVDKTNSELMRQIRDLRLNGNAHLLGERSDISEITAGLDIACSCSSFVSFLSDSTIALAPSNTLSGDGGC